jgi:hypothetical protein
LCYVADIPAYSGSTLYNSYGVVYDPLGFPTFVLNPVSNSWTYKIFFNGNILNGMNIKCQPSNTPMTISNAVGTCLLYNSPTTTDNTYMSLYPLTRTTYSPIRSFNGTNITTSIYGYDYPSSGIFARLIYALAVSAQESVMFSGTAVTAVISAPSSNYSLPQSSSSFEMPSPISIVYESDGTGATCPGPTTISGTSCVFGTMTSTGTMPQMNCSFTPGAGVMTYDGCRVNATIYRVSNSISYSWYMGYLIDSAPVVAATTVGILANTAQWTGFIRGTGLPRNYSNEISSFTFSTSCGVTIPNVCNMGSFTSSGTYVQCNFTTPLPEGCYAYAQVSRRGFVSNTASFVLSVARPAATASVNARVALPSKLWFQFTIAGLGISSSQVILDWSVANCNDTTPDQLGLASGVWNPACTMTGNTVNCSVSSIANVPESCQLSVRATRLGVAHTVYTAVANFARGSPQATITNIGTAMLSNQLISVEIEGSNLPIQSEPATVAWVLVSGSASTSCFGYTVLASTATDLNVTKAVCFANITLQPGLPSDFASAKLQIKRFGSADPVVVTTTQSISVIRGAPDVVPPAIVPNSLQNVFTPIYVKVDVTYGIGSSLEKSNLSGSFWTIQSPCSFAASAPAVCDYLNPTSLNCSMTTAINFNGATDCLLYARIVRLGVTGTSGAVVRAIRDPSPVVNPAGIFYTADGTPRPITITGAYLGDLIKVTLSTGPNISCSNVGAVLDCLFVTIITPNTTVKCWALLDGFQGCSLSATVTKNSLVSSPTVIGAVAVPSSPVVPPVASPVRPPVTAPISPPLAAPIIAPVSPPIASPMAQPVSAPTKAPVAAPTAPPVAAPAAVPISAPITAPVSVPTTVAPVATPAEAPVAAPVFAPSVVPLAAPTATPAPTPVDVPMSAPAPAPAAVPQAAPTATPAAIPPITAPIFATEATPQASPTAAPASIPTPPVAAPFSQNQAAPTGSPTPQNGGLNSPTERANANVDNSASGSTVAIAIVATLCAILAIVAAVFGVLWWKARQLPPVHETL